MKTKNPKKNYIATRSGKKFNLLNPRAKDVDITDIALALSRICRFGGHTREFISVGNHSIHVMLLLREWGAPIKVQLCGLLHDATEAYYGDVVRPLKAFLPFYKSLEDYAHRAIMRGLKLNNVLRLTKAQKKLIKKADNTLALTERRDQINHGGRMPSKDFCGESVPWGRKIRGMEWQQTEKLFLAYYNDLTSCL